MNWKKGVVSGIALWILMFVIVSVLIAFNVYATTTGKVVTIVIAGIISLFLAQRVKPSSAGVAATYGFLWVVIGLILDAIITTRFNPSIFAAKSLWIGYLVVLLAPLFAVKKS